MVGRLFVVACLVLGVHSAAVQVNLKDDKCDVCTNAIAELQLILNDKNAQDLLALGSQFICANIPIENCADWIASEISMVEAVVAGLDAEAVCVQGGLCGEAYISRDALESDGSIQCEFCEFLGDQFEKRLLSNQSLDEVLDTVLKVCSLLPFGSGQCTSLVKEYGRYYLDLLVKQMDIPTICAKLHLCSEDVRHMIEATRLYQTVYAHLKDEEACEACLDGFDIIQEFLNSNETLDMLHIAVKEICEAIGMPQYAILIDTFLDEAIQSLLPLFDPQSICQQIGACNAISTEIVAVQVAATPVCEACTDGLTEVKKILNDADTQVVINSGIEVICASIEIPFCKSLIGNLVKDQLEKIEALDVDSVCSQVGACLSFRPLVAALKKVTNFGDTCSTCSEIIDEVLNMLKNEQLDNMIKQAVADVCTIIPFANCEETIDGYFDEIISIIKYMDGKTLCGMIGMCDARAAENDVEVAVALPVLKLGDTCETCTEIIDEVITLLENGEIDIIIKDAIGELCTLLPIDNCAATLDGYFDELAALLKNMDGKTLCGLMGLCSGSNAMGWYL